MVSQFSEVSKGLKTSETLSTATEIGDSGQDSPITPMTWATMGRFFGVPLLIIGTIVGGSVAVVLLFGGTSAPEQRSIQSLVQALKASGGERSAGVLLPREKELWQTALDLSERLKKKKAELSPAELDELATELAGLVRADLSHLDNVTAFDGDLAVQKDVRATRFVFLLRALARTERPEAIETLIEVIRSRNAPFVVVAMQEAANLHEGLDSRRIVPVILEAMIGNDHRESLLVACTALSVLAAPGDLRVIDALSSVRLSQEGEVAWSAALALGRLGSPAGKSTLLDLMDRDFWKSGERYVTTDERGNTLRYPMPPGRVDEIMTAAIEASLNLKDPDLWAVIDRLQSDASLSVRGAAQKAAERRASASGVVPG